MEQTAVEFLFKQSEAIRKHYNTKAITAEQAMREREEALNIAKEMEKQNMINFLKSVFAMETFDCETFYDKFILGIAPYKQEFPKTQIDWSGFPKSTQEQVGFTEPNIINKWLEENGNPEINKQVEQESIELCEQETIEEDFESYELAEKLFKEIYGYKPQILEGNQQHELIVAALQKGMVHGAKWQQEQFKNKSTANYIDRHIVEALVETAKQVRSYSEEEVRKVLLAIELVNPAHLTMLRSGYGEFPDSYELTDKGVDYIIEQFKKK